MQNGFGLFLPKLSACNDSGEQPNMSDRNGKGKWTRQLNSVNGNQRDKCHKLLEHPSILRRRTMKPSRLLSILLRKVIVSGNIHLFHYCNVRSGCLCNCFGSLRRSQQSLWDASWKRRSWNDLCRNYTDESHRNLHTRRGHCEGGRGRGEEKISECTR